LYTETYFHLSDEEKGQVTSTYLYTSILIFLLVNFFGMGCKQVPEPKYFILMFGSTHL